MVMRAAVTHRTGGKQHQRGTKAFPAAVNNVFSDLPDQNHIGVKSLSDDGIHRLHIGGNRCK
jgi:hypothetical protein